jgi:uncharacterized protein YbaP (TraB family)
MKKISFGIILVLLVCTQAIAETSLWRLQKGRSITYLGGTCHLLRQSDFPLPKEFYTAYDASDVLVFETDLSKLKDAATQQLLMSTAMFSDGSTIKSHLSAQTYNLLKEYCDANGIPLETISLFKPSIVVVTITAMELMKLGVTEEGVDTFFYQQAINDKKFIQELETVEEQIQFLVGMGDGNEDAFVRHSIKDLKSIKQNYESLVDAWKKGDVKKLNDLMVAELKTKTPKLYKELITDRNEKWLHSIDTYQKTPQKEFILVGVGHLVGSDGIVEALRQKGYKVEKF